jgi:uridine kinase
MSTIETLTHRNMDFATSGFTDDLDVRRLRDDIAAQKARAVAIDGRGGSGKSTLARRLADGWPKAVVIEMDDFHRPSAERVQRPEVHGANFDRGRLVTEVLEPLASGRAGHYQRYDWDEDRLAEWHDVPVGAMVIVEGVYSTSELLRGYFDYTIWVDCPSEVRLQRGIERDGEPMRAVWVEEWMPAEDCYVAADRPDAWADLVLDGSGNGADGVVFKILAARNPAAAPGRRLEVTSRPR